MGPLRKDAIRGGVVLLIAAVVAGVLSVGPRTRGAEAESFAITTVTADCDGTGLVYFTGTFPQSGFTLELMDKASDNSGPFVPTSPPTIITITSGNSPVAYTVPLANWSPPHYRVDSNFNTKSPSLFCEVVATNTPQPTATNTALPSATATPTTAATETVSTRTATTTVLSTSTPASTSSVAGAPAAAGPPPVAVNTVLAVERPPDVARLPSALPNTGEADAGAQWTQVVSAVFGMLALGLVVAISGYCHRRMVGRRGR